MSNERRLVYLETTVFLAHLKGEAGRIEDCKAVMTQAEAGDITAITSTVTLTEVIKIPGGHLPESVEVTIDAMFQSKWLHLVQLDRLVATQARQIARKHRLTPLDAIHVASAIARGADKLLTYDQKILDIGSVGHMVICQPAGQRVLDLAIQD
jgi:predicted nucleic acid-binding protein